jgi:hypothetical protein
MGIFIIIQMFLFAKLRNFFEISAGDLFALTFRFAVRPRSIKLLLGKFLVCYCVVFKMLFFNSNLMHVTAGGFDSRGSRQ